jgi:hypothetical protein
MRQNLVMKLIPKNGTTAWEIALKLFPEEGADNVHSFLAVSEAVAHLDLAYSEGKLDVELKDGVEVYKK